MTAGATTLAIIPHSRPYFGREEIEATTRVIQSRHVAQGVEVEQLENEWAAATGNRGSACVGSGLAALRLALHATGVKAGSEVIVPAYSCTALLNAVLALGAAPVLADVKVDRWTLDPESALRRRTPRTAAIIVVHLFGMPAEVAPLRAAGVPIIEDCAHGIGGSVAGTPFGALGSASIASFYATKMIAGGEGGVVASSDENLLKTVKNARNPADQKPSSIFLNDKLTDLEAAIIRVQLSRLRWTLSERAARAARYAELLDPLASRGLVILPAEQDGRIWYRYAVRLSAHPAANVARELYAIGVHADQPVWDLRQAVEWPREFRGSDVAFDRVLSLPLYPDLSPAEQQRVCEALTGVLR